MASQSDRFPSSISDTHWEHGRHDLLRHAHHGVESSHELHIEGYLFMTMERIKHTHRVVFLSTGAMYAIACYATAAHVERMYWCSPLTKQGRTTMNIPADAADLQRSLLISETALANGCSPTVKEHHLNQFRQNQTFLVELPNWYGGYVGHHVPVHSLEKIQGDVGKGQHPLANLRQSMDDHHVVAKKKRYRYLYLDWDGLEDKYPKLWCAFHSTVPWAIHKDGGKKS